MEAVSAVRERVGREASSTIMLSIAREEEVATRFRRLVFEQYQKRNWLDTNDYPDEVVVDKYDAGSDILVIRSNDEVVAGMRIVRDIGMGFPHETEMGLCEPTVRSCGTSEVMKKLTNTPRSRMAEITKVAGKRKQRTLTFDILKCLYWYAVRHEVDLYVMVIDMEFFLLCTTFGVPINPIGTPVYCEGSWTIPAITDASEWPEALLAKSPSAWQYIATQDNLDGSWIKH